MSSSHAIHPSKWEVQHHEAIQQGESYIAEHHTLPDSPIWRMLERRYELNTARFRFWHPESANILDSLKSYIPPTYCDWIKPEHPNFPPYVPPTTGTQVTPDCPIQTVAEPGSVISLMIGCVLLACWSVGRVR